jgi:hypothetical protein
MSIITIWHSIIKTFVYVLVQLVAGVEVRTPTILGIRKKTVTDYESCERGHYYIQKCNCYQQEFGDIIYFK